MESFCEENSAGIFQDIYQAIFRTVHYLWGWRGQVKNDQAIKKVSPEKTGYNFCFFWPKWSSSEKKNTVVRKAVCHAKMAHYNTHTEPRMCPIVFKSGFNIYTWSKAVLFDVVWSSASIFRVCWSIRIFFPRFVLFSSPSFWKIQNESRWPLKIMA